tara:strand:+ start:223 stop:513 length:291 start_codon:yes stop_codon:yes gene_type:complete
MIKDDINATSSTKDDVYKILVTSKDVKSITSMPKESILIQKLFSKESIIAIDMEVKSISTHTSDLYLNQLESYFDIASESESDYFDKSEHSSMSKG